MSRPRLHRWMLSLALVALTGGCDSNGGASSCSGQENCFVYNASNTRDQSSVAGTLVFDEFPLNGGDVSGTWAFRNVGKGKFASHPTGSGQFTGLSEISSIYLILSDGDTQMIISGARTPVLLSGGWRSNNGSGPFSATRSL